MSDTSKENLKNIAEILRVDLSDCEKYYKNHNYNVENLLGIKLSKTVVFIDYMISIRPYFEERFFGENYYYPIKKWDINEKSDYILFIMENQGVFEFYINKNELSQEDPKVYCSEGGIEGVESDGSSSFSTEILHIIESFPNEEAFNPNFLVNDKKYLKKYRNHKKEDFVCRVCNNKVEFNDGDNIIEICEDCSESYDIDELWDDYYNEEIDLKDMNTCDLDSYEI